MRAAKVDVNQKDIVAELRAVGASVEPLHAVGRGVPDLLVGFRNDIWLIEVKSPTAKKRNEGKTDHQVKWHGDWRGKPVVVVRTADEALAAIGVVHHAALYQRIVGKEASRKGGNPSGSDLTTQTAEKG